MSRIEFISNVSGGAIQKPEELRKIFRQFDGQKVRVVIKKYQKKRSLEQNAFYWGVVIPIMVEVFQDYGNNYSSEDVHEFLREHVGKLCTMKEMAGYVVKSCRSTTQLSTIEFETYLTKIRAFAAEHGVYIPFPRESTIEE